MRRLFGYLLVSSAVVFSGVWVAAEMDLTRFQPNTVISSQQMNANFEDIAIALDGMQGRVSESCPQGSAIREIHPDGAVSCEQDDIGPGGDNPGVDSVNGMTGALLLQAGAGVTVDDGSPGRIVISAEASGGDITGVATGTGLAGGGDSGDLTLRIANAYRLPQGCANGGIPEWDGASWSCGSDDVGSGGGGGDITSVTAGAGLEGGGDDGDVSLSVATSYRLPDGCGVNQVAKFDDVASTWVCATDMDTDTDTTYSAGAGLNLEGTSFSVQFSGSGSASRVARSDHHHLGQTWNGTDTPLILEGSYSPNPYAVGAQRGAPLVLANTDSEGHGLRITEAGWHGILVETSGFNGVDVGSAGYNGINVGSAAETGISVNSTGSAGIHIGSAGSDGLNIAAAHDSGIWIGSAGSDGIGVGSVGGNGVRVQDAEVGLRVDSATSVGVRVVTAGSFGVRVSDTGSNGVWVQRAGGSGVDATTDSASHFGGRFANSASGGAGLYALAGDDTTADLVLGGSSSTDDNGRLTSDPGMPSSDLVLISNDRVFIDLDDNEASDSDADGNSLFAIRNGQNSNLLIVYESGNATLAGTLTQLSDRNAKHDIEAVNPEAVLAALLQLPITTWRYNDSPTALHLGPMAQDFHAAFGLGESETGLSSIDTGGVALAAIQGLSQLVESQQALIERQQARLADLEARLSALEEAPTAIATTQP